jgi:hypothetical protein
VTSSTPDYRDLLRELRTSADAVVGRGADQAEIADAELRLDARLPEDYRLFVEWFGWGGRDDWEIYGLGADVPAFLDIVTVATQERTSFGPRLPGTLLPILNDGGSTLYCLKLDAGVGGVCPVVAWALEGDDDQIPQRVSSSFAAWFATLMRMDDPASP